MIRFCTTLIFKTLFYYFILDECMFDSMTPAIATDVKCGKYECVKGLLFILYFKQVISKTFLSCIHNKDNSYYSANNCVLAYETMEAGLPWVKEKNLENYLFSRSGKNKEILWLVWEIWQ